MRKELTAFIVHDCPEGRVVWLPGRVAWALNELIEAGTEGCTPITHPGPRWSAYVHKLRRTFGVQVETTNEAHSGPFAGTHARYHLRSKVSRSKREAA